MSTLDRRTWRKCYGGDAALVNVSVRLGACRPFLKGGLAWIFNGTGYSTRLHLFHRYLARLCSAASPATASNLGEKFEETVDIAGRLREMRHAIVFTHQLVWRLGGEKYAAELESEKALVPLSVNA